jgi:hypothetical protein
MGIVCGKVCRIAGKNFRLGALCLAQTSKSEAAIPPYISTGCSSVFDSWKTVCNKRESCWRVIGSDSMPRMVHPGRTTGSKNGHVEMRVPDVEAKPQNGSWRQLTPEQITLHVMRSTVVGQWLQRRIGVHALLRACTQQSVAAKPTEEESSQEAVAA